MYLGIISLPLISFFIVGLGGRYYGRIASAWIATILIFISFLISLFIW
jgi:NADH:ubiquinone oxidoreductase subunit 5 (subunit L)/multisubunit Na+/H+ antiporter MnhA subunit